MTEVFNKGVLDTNIYRGLPRDGYKDIVKERISTVALSPLNVLEITGIDIPNTEADFKRRQAAARKMIDLRDEWVADPEVYQASLLGCDITGYTFDEYEEMLARFVAAQSLSDLSQQVNVAECRRKRDEYYKQFADKVQLIRLAYLRWCDDNSITKKYDEISISRAMVEIDAHSIVRQTEFERICNLVLQYQSDKDFYNSVLGTPNPDLISVLDDYTAIYTDHIIEHLKAAKVEPGKNDFGDLQFLIYCAGDYCLGTNDKHWLNLAAMGNMADKVISIP